MLRTIIKRMMIFLKMLKKIMLLIGKYNQINFIFLTGQIMLDQFYKDNIDVIYAFNGLNPSSSPKCYKLTNKL
jgi:ascorbate-specific PTS system EIIC-type component UlaA